MKARAIGFISGIFAVSDRIEKIKTANMPWCSELSSDLKVKPAEYRVRVSY